jgi:hypothetical protein
MPDGYFYYALSMGIAGLTAFLIWFAINRYLSRQDARDTKVDETLASIGKTLNELMKITAIHDEKHKSHELKFAEMSRKKRP